jgi:hypothetical protein
MAILVSEEKLRELLWLLVSIRNPITDDVEKIIKECKIHRNKA